MRRDFTTGLFVCIAALIAATTDGTFPPTVSAVVGALVFTTIAVIVVRVGRKRSQVAGMPYFAASAVVNMMSIVAGTGIGVSVGIAVGLIGIALALWDAYLTHKRRQAQN